ncbi:peptidase C1B, bleomycin hydrolase [Pluteus cervinus]|uniref:Peptidase C1B, bleomycin hydrolase n=1 Tax=Pluteus cervinus TaxID=181527 RepID=A0ACD3ACC7_9AGAR|nr:peptidase C1B, bleomycin hydrolase [Pluteus cervinus]
MGSNVSRLDSVEHTSADEKRQEWHIVSSMNSLNLTKTPISTTGSLTLERVADWETEVSSDPKTRLARTILSHSEIRSALSSRSAQIADTFIFNNSLDFKTGPITNQRSSGRCWIFASTNVTRYAIMKKLKLDDFQLSQSYLYFWDKLNKANYFLELSIENAHLPIDDRLVNHLSGSDLLSDGGQWDMFVNLAENYGFVPQTVFPESTHSSLSSPLNSLLKTKLREHGLVLRKTAASLRAAYVPAAQAVQALRAKKEELMKDIYTVMTATLGVPPKPDQKFVWEYKDKDGVTGSWEGTPTEFFNQFATKPYKPSESFSLINDPRNEYGKLYTIDKLGNIWGARPVLYVNTEIQVLKDTVVKMIKADHPVFFGCDVGQFSDKTTGIMDPALYEYEDAFNITLGLTKAERLQLNESAMTHAMVISGVHLDQDGKPVRYKVENSWGDAVGDHGFFVMTDKWFEEFVYQVVVPKPLAPKDLTAVFEAGDKVVLPPWDPLGTLA